jgi:formate hydrogenlyase transcriptional activator
MADDPLNRSEAALIEATLALTAQLDEGATCRAMLDAAERIFAAQSCWILLLDRDSDKLLTAEVRGPSAHAYAGASIGSDDGIVGLAFTRREAMFVPDVQQEDRWYDPARIRSSGVQSVLAVPLMDGDEAIGVVGLDSPLFTPDTPPSKADISGLRALASVAAAGVRNARAMAAVNREQQRLRQLLGERRQLRDEVGQLREQVREAHAVNALIGESAAFRDVLAQVALVAPADSTVLLVGETGTGKEMIARALHEQSRRARNAFIAVNCAALPDTLIESELFGYEKGAFTGALTRKPGKFELADRGTLFLDEIGDLPPQAQAKLLRVLQEREVQRVGGTRAVPVNVRVIAATNQDLEAHMRCGTFRPDLFYRLSVFPIRLPPLRERRDDIPRLVTYFARRYAERQHKPVPRPGPGVMERLASYDWPGNVRELQNVVERAVILARGPVMHDDLFVCTHAVESRDPTVVDAEPGWVLPSASPNIVRFSDAERQAILRAVELAGWRISGDGGAAEILGLKPTTLHAKMKRLGIRRPSMATDPEEGAFTWRHAKAASS